MKNFLIGLAIVAGCAAVLALITTCVQDYRSATLQMVEVRIIDKIHKPGHYEQQCSTQYIESGDMKVPITSCENVWIAPTWTIRYDDGSGSYSLGVNSGMFDTLTIGQQKWLRYYRGGGYYGIRYSEEFLLEKPLAEGAK